MKSLVLEIDMKCGLHIWRCFKNIVNINYPFLTALKFSISSLGNVEQVNANAAEQILPLAMRYQPKDIVLMAIDSN